jgi:hypothetical protein
MREYVFAAEYESGADPLMDVFIDNPSLIGRALRVSVSSAGLWRVDRFTGPSEALECLETVVTDPIVCNECLGVHQNCSYESEYEVVEDGPESRLVYAYTSGGRYCHSVPHLVARTFGEGPLFDARRRGNVYEWRVLLPGEGAGGEVFDRLQDGLPDGVSLSLKQVGTPSSWSPVDISQTALSHDQRRAIETAVDLGYYETPRAASLGDIADVLDIPKSTLRYRLRHAEQWVTEQVFSEKQSPVISTNRVSSE